MNLKKLVLAALFITLSFIGANIKIMGSIAFDSMPAYLGALLLGPVYGAVIGFLGHLITALLSGFPFGFVLHCIIAVSMAVTMFCFAVTFNFLEYKVPAKINYTIITIVGTLLNGPAMLVICIPFLGVPAAVGMMPVLTIVSFINIVIAIAVYLGVKKAWSKYI